MSKAKPVAVVVQSASQISLQSPGGGVFDLHKHRGAELYLREHLECEFAQRVGYLPGEARPVEPSNSGEDPEAWAEIAEWESRRADYWEARAKKAEPAAQQEAEPADPARQRRIRHAVVNCKGEFPRQLLGSGVMFFDGERITLEDFNKAKDSMGVQY